VFVPHTQPYFNATFFRQGLLNFVTWLSQIRCPLTKKRLKNKEMIEKTVQTLLQDPRLPVSCYGIYSSTVLIIIARISAIIGTIIAGLQ
jgi:hypothetical protein